MKKQHSFLNLQIPILVMTAILATSCTTSSYSPAPGLVVVAHRGGADLGPENTISTINRGIEAGADMIEIDVHLTLDSQLVVCHDETVDRTTDGHGRIAEMTLAEIKQLHIEGTDEQMPTLAEVLVATKDRCPVLLEIKKRRDQYVGIESRVVYMLRQYGMEDQVVVQSFNEYVLEEISRLDPSLRLEQLSFFPPRHPERYSHIASFNICHYFITARFIKRAHAIDREVKIWTVNSHNRASRLPVDGIITNNPALFISNR